MLQIRQQFALQFLWTVLILVARWCA